MLAREPTKLMGTALLQERQPRTRAMTIGKPPLIERIFDWLQYQSQRGTKNEFEQWGRKREAEQKRKWVTSTTQRSQIQQRKDKEQTRNLTATLKQVTERLEAFLEQVRRSVQPPVAPPKPA